MRLRLCDNKHSMLYIDFDCEVIDKSDMFEIYLTFYFYGPDLSAKITKNKIKLKAKSFFKFIEKYPFISIYSNEVDFFKESIDSFADNKKITDYFYFGHQCSYYDDYSKRMYKDVIETYATQKENFTKYNIYNKL